MTQMVPGPLYGYRNWTLREDGLLYSLNDGLAWTPGRITAAVCRKGHPAPVRGCSCGFYAYRSPTQNAQSRVALWGRVVGHRLGYRAEFAYPIELVVADRVEQSWLDRLTQHYGCVVVRESMVNAPAVVSGRPHELGRIIRAQEAARRFGVPKAYPDHVLPFQWFSRREVYQSTPNHYQCCPVPDSLVAILEDAVQCRLFDKVLIWNYTYGFRPVFHQIYGQTCQGYIHLGGWQHGAREAI